MNSLSPNEQFSNQAVSQCLNYLENLQEASKQTRGNHPQPHLNRRKAMTVSSQIQESSNQLIEIALKQGLAVSRNQSNGQQQLSQQSTMESENESASSSSSSEEDENQ